jgi:hypothetical protein
VSLVLAGPGGGVAGRPALVYDKNILPCHLDRGGEVSHGLGVMQRKMLAHLAAWEAVEAEQAAERQETYQPPASRWRCARSSSVSIFGR